MCGTPKFLAAVLIFLASYSAYGDTGRQTSESAQNQPPAEELVRFNRFMGLVKELRSNINRAQFDLDALLSSLEYDDLAIVEFVKTQIRFEPYSGSLRGALGTLKSRAGNSLDQSILLATLLNNAGFEARIVRGDLTIDAVRNLLFEALTSSVDRPPIGDVLAIEKTLKKIEELYETADLDAFGLVSQGTDVDSFALNPRPRVQHHLDIVLKSLSSNGRSLDYERPVEPLIEQLIDYFWVEYRLGRADSWSSSHPAYRESSPLVENLIVKATFSESVPQDLVHRVKIEAFVKRKHGSEEATISVGGPWERPAANLGSVPISYSNFPLALAGMPDWTDPVYQATHESPFEAAYKEAMQEPTFFAPMLNGQIAPAAQFFDLAGNVVPPEVAASDMAAMFQTLGEKAAKVSGALGNLGLTADSADTTTSTKILLEQWLEITLIRPGEKDKKVKRQLIAAPFGGKERFVGLGQDVTFSVETGSLPESYFIDALLGELENIEDSLRTLLQYEEKEKNSTKSSSGLESSEIEFKPIWDLFFFLMADQAREMIGETRVFRSEPSVVARYRNVWLQDLEYQGFDIVNNTRRAMKVKDADIHYAPRDAVLFGIWETLVERLANPVGRGEGFNTIEAFEARKAVAGDELPQLTWPGELSSDALGFETSAFMRSDLASGFTLIFPAGSGVGEPPVAWWRVNVETGETLGMLSMGWGGVTAEWMVKQLPGLINIPVVKVTRAITTCGFILGTVSAVAAVGTGNLDHWFPLLSHDMVAVIGYAIAMVVQTPGAKEAFMKQCVWRLVV